MPFLHSLTHHYADLGEWFSQKVLPEPAINPQWIAFNAALAIELQLVSADEFTADPISTPNPTPTTFNSDANDNNASLNELLPFLSGQSIPGGALPVAQAYAGHQFGHFNPQLGDGRAVLLGDAQDADGRYWDIQLKGSGVTPFSRSGDGKAALGPVIREYVLSEAMHALGIPTTRALSAVLTGELIYREGHVPGAIVSRVAASHIRIGTFEYFARKGQTEAVKKLADYAISRHYPELYSEEFSAPESCGAESSGGHNIYFAFFKAVAKAQADLVSQWMSVGFIHGVMNTDNVSIAGETIDYGPCAFMDGYKADQCFSSIDRRKRYAFDRQRHIMVWNLARLAECLLFLIDEDQQKSIALVEKELHALGEHFDEVHQARIAKKLGLEVEDNDLVEAFWALLESSNADFTLSFRLLGEGAVSGNYAPWLLLFEASQDLAQQWLDEWAALVGGRQNLNETGLAMRAINPAIIPRNHWVESVIAASYDSLMQQANAPFDAMHSMFEKLIDPFSVQHDGAEYALPPSNEAEGYRTFCGT